MKLLLLSSMLFCFASVNSCSINHKDHTKLNIPQRDSTIVKVIMTDEEWKKVLGPDAYLVLRKKATEPAFSGDLNANKKKGTYCCKGCGNLLFSSGHKFDSGTGWPSFTRTYNAYAVDEIEDRSGGMLRTEVICAKCEGHLGHVFDDGPAPTRLRYCINSLALEFRAEP